MKSSKLFITSLLAAAASLSVPAYAATATLTSTTTTISESDAATYGIAAGTYSGNIIQLTAAGSEEFHNGTFTIYNTDSDGAISTTTGVNGTTSTALTNQGVAGSRQTLWNYFVGNGSTLSSDYTYGETLYVSAATLSGGNLTANMTFGPVALGGLVVGASDNTFETGRTGKKHSDAICRCERFGRRFQHRFKHEASRRTRLRRERESKLDHRERENFKSA